MSYYMADRKHRKAFLEARQSLEVKLNLEEQSQQQVGATAGQGDSVGTGRGDGGGTPAWLWDVDKAPAACSLPGAEGPWPVAVGTGGHALAVLHPVPSLGTLHVTVLVQGLPAPAVAATKLSPSLSMAMQQVSGHGHVAGPHPRAQSHCRSPGAATWQVPRHGLAACPCPQARLGGRSPGTATWQVPRHGLAACPRPQAWPQSRSPSPCTAPWHVPSPVHTHVACPQAQPCSGSLSPGMTRWLVPVPAHSRVAGPQMWPRSRSPSPGRVTSSSLSPALAMQQLPITKQSMSPCHAAVLVPRHGHTAGPNPQAWPYSRCLSLNVATQQVPVPRHGHARPLRGPSP